jgi:hypothetical protein
MYFLLLLLLALHPTMGFSLLSDFLPFRPFLAQFSPPSYSHRLEVFFNVVNPSIPGSSSNSPPYWDECILILVIYWKKTGLLHTKISNHNIIYSS